MGNNRGHRSAQYWDMLDSAKKKGFTTKQLKNGQIAIYPPDASLPFYTSHPGETGLHPLRRFIDRTMLQMQGKTKNVT